MTPFEKARFSSMSTEQGTIKLPSRNVDFRHRGH